MLTLSNPAVTLTSSYGTSYQWSEGSTTRAVNITQPGSYCVAITGTNGCSNVSDQISVQSDACAPPHIPSISLNSQPVIIDGETVVLTATEGRKYLWSNGATTQSITVDKAGT